MRRKTVRSGVTALAALACLVLLAGPLHAQHCYSGASHAYGYAASYYPSYSYSYTPSYSYYTPTYSYVKPVYKYEVKEVVVPKAVKAYVSPDYFASSSDYYRDKVLLDAIAGKNTDAQKLQQELVELRTQIQRQAQPQQYTPQMVPQAPAPYAYQAPQYTQNYLPPAAAPPTAYQQPQQSPQGGTPCDWRAQEAYQRGLAEAQAQLRQQQYPGPQQSQQGPPQAPQQPQGTQAGYPPPQAPQGPQQAPQGQQRDPYQRPETRPTQQVPQQPGGVMPPVNGTAPLQGGTPGHKPPPSSQEKLSPEAEARADDQDYGPVPEGLEKVVSNSCLRCHGDTAGDDGKGFDLRNLKAVTMEMRSESWGQVAEGDMPHKAQKLPPEEIKLFKVWFRNAKKFAGTRAVASR
jgi:hypothetical protein